MLDRPSFTSLDDGISLGGNEWMDPFHQRPATAAGRLARSRGCRVRSGCTANTCLLRDVIGEGDAIEANLDLPGFLTQVIEIYHGMT